MVKIATNSSWKMKGLADIWASNQEEGDVVGCIAMMDLETN